jgi:SnoaL-like domain
MKTLADFAALRAIEGTKARYCRFMDTKRWQEWGLLFTDDASLDVSEDVTPEMGPQVVHGRAAIVAQVRGVVDTARTTHQVHSPEIALTSETTASGIWAMHDVVVWPEGTPRPVPGLNSLTGFGHYHETYRLDAGEWRIVTLKLTRLQRIFG